MANVNLRSTKAEIFRALRITRHDLAAAQGDVTRLQALVRDNERIRKDIAAERDVTVKELRQRCLDLSGDRIRELIDARKEIHRLGVELTQAEKNVAAANRREGEAMAKVARLMYRPTLLRRLLSRLTHW